MNSVNASCIFFIDKVSLARTQISPPTFDPSAPPTCSPAFHQFEPISLSQLEEVVSHLKPSGSPHDAIPPRLLKEVFSTIGPIVLSIINGSLTFGIVPNHFKHAVVLPLLKKTGLDPNVLSNFRPISKLPFLSKILEKIVYGQLLAHLNENNLLEVFQYGFKPMHSTESALLRVFNDILLTCDSGDCVALVLLDLTAAFDTVDHDILISRLENCAGVKGVALNWFKSYLKGRTFNVRLNDFVSTHAPLCCGVPQGSVLAPMLFSLYLLPLGSIFRKHGVSFHCYANDCQIYVPLQKKEGFPLSSLQLCLDDVKAWMALNFLHFNDSKTEVMVFSPSSNMNWVDLGNLSEYRKEEMVNLGFKMDPFSQVC